MVAPLEREVQAKVKKLYKQVGGTVWDTSQRRKAHVTPGVPDLVVTIPHRRAAFFHETKAPGGKMSDEQKEFRKLAAQCEWKVVVAPGTAVSTGRLRR